MCTVTVVPLADGFRLMCNRDEQHARPAALPPRAVRVGGRQATMPIDPQGGGTWMAVTDDGLALALLNRVAPPAVTLDSRLRTRGEIVTSIAASRNLDEAIRALRTIDPTKYRPFQLVAVAGGEALAVVSDGARLDPVVRPLHLPVMFTSSSRGDLSAERMRRPLFEAMVLRADDWLAGQRDFHAHRWPRCGVFSVLMCRDDARTVSRSIIEVRRRSSSFVYEPIARHSPCQPSHSP